MDCVYKLIYLTLFFFIFQEVKSENPTTWNVLRDNFLTGSNMKDWDKCGEVKLEDDLDEIELN